MKRFLLLASLCLAMNVQADSNLFHCKGEDVTLSFSKSSFIGKPLLHLERNDKTIHFQGEDAIKMKKQVDGLLVTATGRGDYVSFLIPNDDQEFDTTVKLNGYMKPKLHEVLVQCKGQSVQF